MIYFFFQIQPLSFLILLPQLSWFAFSVSTSFEEDITRTSHCLSAGWCSYGGIVLSRLLFHWCSGTEFHFSFCIAVYYFCFVELGSFQRVALSTAANMCKKLPSDAADFVMEAVPLLTNLLNYHDSKVSFSF